MALIYRKYAISTPASSGAFTARIWRADGRLFRIDGATHDSYETMTRFDRDDAIEDAKKVVDKARLVPLK